MEKSEALAEIARLLGGDDLRAREFCRSVQKQCQIVPSFVSIAEAMARSDLDKATTREIAQLAGQIHRGFAVLVEEESKPVQSAEAEEHDEEEDDEEDDDANQSMITPIDDAILPAASAFVETISKHVLGTVFAGSIEGKVIGFTGNGPYYEADLDRLAAKLKAIPDREGIEWGDLEWVVIGSEEFDSDYLENAAKVPYVIFTSQEEFLGALLFGESSTLPSAYTSSDHTHTGMKYALGLDRRGRLDDQSRITSNIAPTELHPTPSKPVRPHEPSPAPKAPEKADQKPASGSFSPTRATDPARTTAPASATPVVTNNPKSHQTPPPNGKPKVTPIPVTDLPKYWGPMKGSPRSSPPSTPWNNAQPPRIEDKAIRFPDLHPTASHEPGDIDASGMRMESELRKLGYTVKKGSIRTLRRIALQKGVDTLGLQNVINHLAWLIRFHRHKESFYDAVARWQDDLEWLKSVFKKDIR